MALDMAELLIIRAGWQDRGYCRVFIVALSLQLVNLQLHPDAEQRGLQYVSFRPCHSPVAFPKGYLTALETYQTERGNSKRLTRKPRRIVIFNVSKIRTQ